MFVMVRSIHSFLSNFIFDLILSNLFDLLVNFLPLDFDD